MPQDKVISVGPPLGGLRADMPSTLLPPHFATDLLNVDLSESVLTKRAGSALIGTNLPLGTPVLGIHQFADYSGNMYTVACTSNNIYKLDAAKAWVGINNGSSWAPSEDTGVESAFMINKLLLTNGNDPIRVWSGDTPTVLDLPNAALYRAKAVVPFMTRMLFLNMTESGASVPQRLRWTAIGTVDDFTSPTSGFYDLVDTPGHILKGVKLGEGLVIYKTDSIVVCTYIGGAPVFSFDVRVASVGAVSPRGIVDMGSSHIFVAHDNIYKFTGGREPEPIGEAIKDYLFAVAKDSKIQRVIVKRFGAQAWFFVPVEDDYPDYIFVYDTRRDNWAIHKLNSSVSACGHYTDHTTITIGDLQGTIGDLSGAIGDYGSSDIRPNICFGTPAGDVYYISEVFGSDAGVGIRSMWASGDIVNIVENRVAYNRYRYVSVEAKGDSMEVEYSLDEGSTWKVLKQVALTSQYNWYKLWFDAYGSRIRIRVNNQNANENFYLRGVLLGMLGDVTR